jgi:DNA-binding NarL/FixJ family response regulator
MLAARSRQPVRRKHAPRKEGHGLAADYTRPPVDTPATPVATRTVVLIVADDLIWSSRLRAAVEKAGAQAHVLTDATQPGDEPVIVDLNGRGYDGIDVITSAAAAGHAVLAVGQHEDLELRKAALAAGAKRVFSYNKLFSDGPSVVAALIEGKL